MARNRSGIPSAARGEGSLSGRTGGPVGFSDYPSKYHGYGRRKGPKTPKVRPVTQYTGKEWEAELTRVENKQKKGAKVTRQKQALSGRGAAQRRANEAAETRKDNIRKSKARGTYRARKSGGVGAAGFNPKLGRTSPTDFIRGGRAPGGIPRKKL